jgi:D-3-phosphoglycerate dehydrogenase
MTRPRVFIPDPIHRDGVERLAGHFIVEMPATDAEARRRGFASADAAIVRNLPVGADVLDAASRLKVIAKHGAGYDTIDSAQRRRGASSWRTCLAAMRMRSRNTPSP